MKPKRTPSLNQGVPPHVEEARGGVEPWLMVRWKARVEFLLNVIELFLYLTVEALQGKTCVVFLDNFDNKGLHEQ